MEDAPLILKKSILGDKCGSCNQYIQDKNNNLVNNMSQYNNPSMNASQYMGPTQYMSPTMYGGPNSNNSFANNQNSKSQSIKVKDTSFEISQLRNIQDSSNKFNSGSYSRILNHAMDDNIKEDLKPSLNSRNGSHNALPNVNQSQEKNSKNKIKDKLLNPDGYTPSPYKDILEKGDKGKINGNQLVILANKEFDKLVKLNANKDAK